MGEVATGEDWFFVEGWQDSRFKDANMSSSSDMVEAVTETIAASTLCTSRCETMLSLDAITSESATSSPSRGPIANRSSWIKRGSEKSMTERTSWLW